ncbi:MAG: hypothetical protein R3264_08465 [Anaerolineae bacterium]|nr:hypothetical protein [Anaerolineae bacterium]
MQFNSNEIRNILKSKADCLMVGFSTNHTIIKTLDDIRESYIRTVGLTEYLREMLGELGQTPVEYCKLYGADGRPLELPRRGNYRQSVHRFIARQFHLGGTIPFKVEIHNQTNLNQVLVCYL